MESIKLEDSYFSKEELKDVMQLVAKKRNIKNYKNKSNDELHKTFKKQSKNKERIDNIREELKDLSYKLSKSEFKEIKKNLYNIEKYNDHDDYECKGIKDIKDLFKLSIDKDYYKPVLVKSGYNKNYVQYESKGGKILAPKEYLTLIEKCLRELINKYKDEGEWKIQLIAEINFISPKLGSDETRIMHTRSDNDEFMNGSDTDEVIKLLFEPSKFKPFINKYNRKDIDFPSTSKDWKKIESNNEVALNILYVPHNTKNKYCL